MQDWHAHCCILAHAHALLPSHPAAPPSLRQRRLSLLLGSTGQDIFGVDTLGNCNYINTAGAQIAQFDEVLLDIAMPRQNGMETLAQLRQQWPDLPVLILSTYAEG